MSDYLWDKQGDPDPEVERLEALLRPLAHRPTLHLLPQSAASPRRRRAWIGLATVAAAALICLVASQPWKWHGAATSIEPARWLASIDGAGARYDGQPIAGETQIAAGAWLDSGASRARLFVSTIGTVDLAPGTRARIVESGAQQRRLELAWGTLSAHIDAPPRLFAVATRRLVVTDLGCAFTLAVDAAGRGQLVVTAGKVAVAAGAAPEVEVAAGTRCDLTDSGPGAPYAADGRVKATDSGSGAPYAADGQLHAPVAPAAPKLLDTAQPARKIVKPAASTAALRHSDPARKAKPPRNVNPAHQSGPARPSDSARPSETTRITHDPLKDLQRSVE